MTARQWALAGLMATAALASSLARADISLAGVKYEEVSDLRGNKLQLNGAGIRYKGPFKVYAAGLYVSRKSSTPEEVFATPGAKRIAVTMLRDIDTNQLAKLFIRGVEDNLDKPTFSKLIPGLMRMSQIFSEHKQLQAGDSFSLDWVPGVGAVVMLKGVQQGEPFKEPEFFNALLRIWLGPVPADWKLKDSLLGKPA